MTASGAAFKIAFIVEQIMAMIEVSLFDLSVRLCVRS